MGTESGVDATVTSNNKQAGRLTAMCGRSPQGQWQIVIVNWATGKKEGSQGVSVQSSVVSERERWPQFLSLSAVESKPANKDRINTIHFFAQSTDGALLLEHPGTFIAKSTFSGRAP
jgi:hypothetical protein